MKKIFVLLAMVFIFTGCTIEYNIDINEFSYSEDLYIIENHQKYYKETGLNYKNLIGINKQSVEMELDQPTQIEYMNLSNYFTLFDSGAHLFNDGRFYSQYPLPIYKCYENYVFENKSGVITLETSGKFLCPNFLQKADDIILNIYSDYELIDTNANSINDNKYTWDIKNNTDKKIYLKLQVTDKTSEIEEPITVNWNLISMIMAIVFVIIGIVFLIIILLKNRVNKI